MNLKANVVKLGLIDSLYRLPSVIRHNFNEFRWYYGTKYALVMCWNIARHKVV